MKYFKSKIIMNFVTLVLTLGFFAAGPNVQTPDMKFCQNEP